MGQHVHEWVKIAPCPGRQGFYRWQCKCGVARLGAEPRNFRPPGPSIAPASPDLPVEARYKVTDPIRMRL